MNAEQPTTNPIDGYDCASSSSYPTGLQNFRYDGFPKWFTGKERDQESGLDYFGASDDD